MEDELVALDVTREFLDSQAQSQFLTWLLNDVSGFAMFWLDKAGRIINWNQGAQRLTGISAGEITGHPLSDLFEICAVHQQKTLQLCLKIAARQDVYEEKKWWTRRDGSRFSAEILIMHIAQNGGGFLVMIWDISKNKRLASELNKHPGSSLLDD